MRHLPLLFALAFGLAATPAFAETAPQEDEAAKVARLTQQIEAAPLRDDARAARAWLLGWAEKSPIAITVCNVMGLLDESEDKYEAELVVQQMIGNGAFQLAHPEVADPAAHQVAGVESALRAYEAMLAQDPQARIAHLDELVAQRNAGTLAAYLAPTIARECAGEPQPEATDAP